MEEKTLAGEAREEKGREKSRRKERSADGSSSERREAKVESERGASSVNKCMGMHAEHERRERE